MCANELNRGVPSPEERKAAREALSDCEMVGRPLTADEARIIGWTLNCLEFEWGAADEACIQAGEETTDLDESLWMHPDYMPLYPRINNLNVRHAAVLRVDDSRVNEDKLRPRELVELTQRYIDGKEWVKDTKPWARSVGSDLLENLIGCITELGGILADACAWGDTLDDARTQDQAAQEEAREGLDDALIRGRRLLRD